VKSHHNYNKRKLGLEEVRGYRRGSEKIREVKRKDRKKV